MYLLHLASGHIGRPTAYCHHCGATWRWYGGGDLPIPPAMPVCCGRVTDDLSLPTLNPETCGECDRPAVCRVIATGTRPCDLPLRQEQRERVHNFRDDLSALINRHSKENPSNTPDFILALFLEGVLNAWDQAVQQRETWYGRDGRPVPPGEVIGPFR